MPFSMLACFNTKHVTVHMFPTSFVASCTKYEVHPEIANLGSALAVPAGVDMRGPGGLCAMSTAAVRGISTADKCLRGAPLLCR